MLILTHFLNKNDDIFHFKEIIVSKQFTNRSLSSFYPIDLQIKQKRRSKYVYRKSKQNSQQT